MRHRIVGKIVKVFLSHLGEVAAGRWGLFPLAAHRNLSAAQTPGEKERLERQIAVTDRAIDALVYELYGLSEEEIRIVEG